MHTPNSLGQEQERKNAPFSLKKAIRECMAYILKECRTLFTMDADAMMSRELVSFGKVGYDEFQALNLALEHSLSEISLDAYVQFREIKRKQVVRYRDGKLYFGSAAQKQCAEISAMITVYGCFLEYLASSNAVNEQLKNKITESMRYFCTEPLPSWGMSIRELLGKHGFGL